MTGVQTCALPISGHIRDTESSALQILRIIQEEALKDNTAAVHAQVPVEVTSFLLNEKRTEITKIELKQRVNVLLIPNPHIETPNYKLERLRHDDPRLESFKASYTMIEEPDDEVGITRREKAKAKQEPVIKGVLPDQPAPIAPPPPAPVAAVQPVAAVRAAAPAATAPAPAGGGFFSWVKKLFGTDAPAPTTAPIAAATEAKPKSAGKEERGEGRGPRGERGERGEGRRDGRRNGGRRGEGRGEGRGETKEGREAREPREARETREPREPREPREGRGEGRRDAPRSDVPRDAQPAEAKREPRPPRGEGRRSEAAPAQSEAQAALPAMTLAASLPPAPEGAGLAMADDAGERDASRRRRRRGGRGRNRGEGAPIGLSGEAGSDVNGELNEGGDEAFADNANDGAATQPVSEAPAEAMQPVAARPSEPVHVQPAPSAPPETMPAAEPVPAPPAPQRRAAAAPIVVPLPAAPAPIEPYRLSIDELNQVASAAGLEWVNSDADKVRAVQQAIAAAPPPARAPRAQAAGRAG